MSRHPSADKRKRSQFTEHRRLCCRRLALLLIGTVLSTAPAQSQAQNIYSDQTIYGWATFYGATAGLCSIDESFTTATGWGRRYHVVVKNGATHATSVTLSIDGQEWIGLSEFSSSVDSLTRVVDITHAVEGQNTTHTLDVCVTGPSGSSVSVRVYHLTDPTFLVFGPYTFTRLNPIADDITSFLNSYEATTPYELRVRNGAGDGTNRVSNATLHLNDSQVLSASDFGNGVATITRSVSPIGPTVYYPFCQCFENDVEDAVKGRNESGTGTYFTARIRGTDASAPSLTVNSNSPTEGLVTEAGSVTVSGTSDDSQTKVLLTVSDSTTGTANTPVRGNGNFSDTFTLSADRKYTIKVRAENSAGLAASNVFRHVTRDRLNPWLSVNWPPAFHTISSDSLTIHVSWADTTHSYITVDGDTVASGKYGTYTPAYPLDLGSNRIVFTASDALGHATTIIRYVFRTTPGEGSPPTLSATGLNMTEVEPFLSQVRFLFGAGSPIQTDVPDTTVFSPGRAAVIHGQVFARDFGALSNVTVNVLDHPEYGATKTRSDGQFDMVVNGGGRLVVRFLKDKYLEAQRSVDVPINDYAVVDSLALIGRSERSYYADTSMVSTITGRFESDSSGNRRMYLLVPNGALATITPSGGSPITGVWRYRIRLKEFTVGAGGPSTMPSSLPAATAYTYCVDLSLVEADSITALAGLGALPADVQFSKPIVTYVKDFLDLPVGTVMPSGYYDLRRAQWVANDNGRVIKVLATSGGVASLDTDGNGVADTLAQYVAVGIDTLERTKIATLFKSGDILWRDPIKHFSRHDFNLNTATTGGLGSSNAASAGVGTPLIGDPDKTCGCVIENDNRVLGESIPIKGTPLTLNYRSSRQFGDKAGRWIRIPLTGATVPAGLKRVRLQVDVAGKRYSTVYSGITTNDVRMFSSWDGKDRYGRQVPGSVTATVRLGYVFQQAYAVKTSGSGSFANSGSTRSANGQVATRDRDLDLSDWITQKVSVGAPSMASAGLGGWTLSPHHFYDTNGRGALYLGDGGVRYGYQQYPIVKRFAGTGSYASQGPDTTAFRMSVPISPGDLAFGPDGSLFFIGAIGLGQSSHHVVFRIRPNGTIIPWAGCLNCNEATSTNDPQDGDFAVSTTRRLASPNGLAVGPDGSVYISDEGWRQVYKITQDDTLHVVAGKYSLGLGGFLEGVVAKTHALSSPSAVGVGPDGSIYIGDFGYRRVVRVGPDGLMHSFAGDSCCVNASAGKADSIMLNSNLNVSGIAVSPQGNVYLADGTKVWLVTPDGQARSISGPDHGAFELALGPGGDLYIGTGVGYNGVVRRETDGTLSTIAGTYPDVIGGTFVPANFGAEEGGFARAARLEGTGGVAVGSDGNVYVGQVGTGQFSGGFGIRVITTELPGQTSSEIGYPSEDGRQVHYFTLTGRHKRTMDVTTGVTLYAFDYDGAGRLLRIRDANGDTTTIQRSGTGVPLAIVAPHGQRTTLALDGNGYLAQVSDSLAGETYELDYASDGLLQHFSNPRSKEQTFTYNSDDGRLHYDLDPAGATQTLEHTDAGLTQTVTRTTEEGRVSTYQVTRMLDGLRRRLINYPSHGWSYRTDSMNTATTPYGDVTKQVGPAGEITLGYPARDKRYGMLAQVPATTYTILPSGLRRTVTATRDTAVGGVITETRGLNGNTFTTTYTQSTKTLLTTTPTDRTISATLDGAGRVISGQVGSLTPVEFAYDSHGRMIYLRRGSRGWSYVYDGSGRLTTVTDTLGRATTFAYDKADRDTMQTLPGSREVHLGYDANGNVTRVTPPGGAAHQFGYTDVDLNDAYVAPAVAGIGNSTTHEFNDDRQLTKITRPDTTVTLDYDGTTGQLTSITHTQGTSTFGYTSSPPTGQLYTATAADGTIVTEDYDGPLLKKETWSGTMSGSVERTFNQGFRDSTEKVNSGSEVSFRYDADGLLTGAGKLFIHRRSGDGLIDSTRAGAVGSHAFYNDVGELKELQYTVADSVYFKQHLYRDALGRIIRIAETVDGQTHMNVFRYDVASRLDSVAVDSAQVAVFVYDGHNAGNGNRTSVIGASAPDTLSATFDAQDRMLRYGGAAYSYTPNGELRKIKRSGTDSTQFTYDALGNLVRVMTPDGHQIDYLTDGKNRRVGYKVDGILQRLWLYRNGLNPVAELSRTGDVVGRFIYGTQSHVPDLLLKGGHGYRLVTDYLGSIRAAVDTADGTTAQRIDYDAWGVRTTDTAPAFQPLGYAGGLTDSATSMVRFGARDYQPSTSRWTSKDPMGPTVSLGQYTYVDGSPLDAVDPSGLFRMYGNWGGQNWRNGARGSEVGDFPYLPSHPQFQRPLNLPDECFWEHDIALKKCACLGDDVTRRSCRHEADVDLISCLATMGNRGTWLDGMNEVVFAPVEVAFWIFRFNDNPGGPPGCQCKGATQ